MLVWIKQDGVWKTSTPKIKVDGTWRDTKEVYIKQNGVWEVVSPSWAGFPCLLSTYTADTRSVIYDNLIYFTGTDFTDSIHIDSIDISAFVNTCPCSSANRNILTYRPNDYWDVFRDPYNNSNIYGQGVVLYDTGDILYHWIGHMFIGAGLSQPTGFFSVIYKSHPEDNFHCIGLNDMDTTRVHSSIEPIVQDVEVEKRRIRLLNQIFIDCEHNIKPKAADTHWVTYDWFSANESGIWTGNNVALFNWTNSGDPIEIATAEPPDYVAEGGILFKRGSYYYIQYSRNHFAGGYTLYWRKATSIPTLATATEYTLFEAEQSGTGGDGEKRYSRNYGHGSVIVYNNRYYILYIVGVPTDGNYLCTSKPNNVSRHTIIDELKFTLSGDMVSPERPTMYLPR